jgi:hypothetical protein
MRNLSTTAQLVDLSLLNSRPEHLEVEVEVVKLV